MVSIKLKGQEHFFYTLHQCEIEGKQWEVRESPGPLFHGAETSQFATLDEAIADVGDWLGRIVAQVTPVEANSHPRVSTPRDATPKT